MTRTFIHKFIFFLMRFSLFRTLAFIPISIGNVFKKEKANYLNYRKKKVEKLIFNDILMNNLNVLSGPFKGMVYPAFKAFTSSIIPKLLGSYESEIADELEHLLANEAYEVVIDIGTAEGYYAVGIAMRLPAAQVIGYDINPEALDFCKTMANRNSVTNLELKGLFRREEFIPFHKKRALVICDVDGFEYPLFLKSNIEWFKTFDLIIETHDYLKAGNTDEIVNFLSDTHDIKVIHWEKEKTNLELPINLKNASSEFKITATRERIVDNKWIIAKSKLVN